MTLVLVMLLAIAIRALPVVLADFPINDGGLFLSMAWDLRTAGFALPETISYNQLDAPFAYPPLAFYVLAAAEAMGIDGFEFLRWFPLLVSVATVLVAYLIGREIFRSDAMGVGTAACFAVSTRAYEWQIMGGGLTRAPGLLLALLAILFAIRAYRSGLKREAVLAGVALGATGLVHPQATIFGVLSSILLMPFCADDRRTGVRQLLVVLGAAALIVLPWATLMLVRHGVGPYLDAAGTGDELLSGIRALLTAQTSGGWLEVLAFATLLGLLICALRGYWLAPAWLLALLVIDGRAGLTFIALPAAMAVTFMLRDLGRTLQRQWPRSGRRASALIGAVLVMVVAADSIASQRQPESPIRALPASTRAAMAWVADETPPDASFVVVAGRFWAQDAEAEWFPVLAERRSLTTVQGYEWVDAAAFSTQVDRSLELPTCSAAEDLECIEAWFERADDVDYLFLTRSAVAEARGLDCCLRLADQVAAFATPETVYAADGILIVRLAPLRGTR